MLARVARLAGAIALALVAIAALAVGTLWMVLETRAGSEWVRRLALPRVNARLAGRLEVEQLRFGGDHLTLQGVVLRDPGGLVVARVARLDVAFSPLSLLRRHLDLSSLRIERPEVLLVQDRRGLNLTRAIAARNPQPDAGNVEKEKASGGNGGGGLVVDLGQLVVRGALFDFRSKSPGGARHIRAADLAIDGTGHFDAAHDVVAARLQIDGRAEAPLRPVAMSVRADLHKTGDLVAFATQLAAGHAQVTADGAVDLARLQTGAAGIAVRARDIDLAELWSDAPRSELAFDFDAKGGGSDLDTLDGSLSFSLPSGRLDGQSFGPVQLSARAQRGAYDVASLLAVLPGVRISGAGKVSRANLNMHLAIDASDLRLLARSLAPPHRPDLRLPLPVAGRGRLDLTLGGTLERPTLRATARFSQLALADNRFTQLSLDALIPNLRDPLGADADLRIATAHLGARVVGDLRAHLRAAGERIALDLRAARPAQLAVSAAGRWGHARQALTLDSLRVSYSEATWSLVGPARLSFAGERIEVDDLALRSGPQLLRASFARAGETMRGHLALSHFDLALLPRLLVPPELQVGGQLDLDGRIGGTGAHPEVEAKVVLSKGRFGDHRDLGLDLDAHYAEGRARGHVEARGLGTALRSHFDLPAIWPLPRDRRTPLHADLTLDETDLVALQKSLAPASHGPPKPPPLRGRARLSLQLDGTTAEPRLAIDAEASQLVVDGRRVGDVSLTLAGDGDRPLHARLTLTRPPAAAPAKVGAPVTSTAGNAAAAGAGTAVAPAAASQLQIDTALSLTSIMRRPPTAQTLLRTHFDLRGDVDQLPLAVLAELARYPDPVGGQLTLHLDASGTALEPRGTLALDVAGATTGQFPPTEGHLEAAFDNHQASASVQVLRKKVTLLAAEAKLGAGLRALREPASFASAPAHLHAVIGPLAMQCLGLPPRTERNPPRTLHGDVRAELAIDGTLAAPEAALHVDAKQIFIDKAPIGTAAVAFDYRARKAKLDVQLTSINRGWLHVLASTAVDLGYPAVMSGVDARKLPVGLHLRAEGFDVQAFSEATAGLRDVGGLLFASADVTGTIADPRFKGRIELKQGLLTVTGFGAYKDVHLALHGDDGNLTLDELFAKSGDGRARLTAQAAHQGAGGYRFDAHASLEKFPIYSDGQALASVSTDASVKGLAAPLDVSADAIVREARVALSDEKKKDLQPLKRPSDVVLMQGGDPLNHAQAEKAEALAVRRERVMGKAGAAPGAGAAAAEPSINTTRIKIDAPRNLWVTGNDVYLELGLTPGFRIEATDKPRIYGQVIVHRGRINILGRRFDVKSDSTLQFNGPSDRPDLDVTAQYTDRADNVTVLLTAKGPIDHLAVAVSSAEHPELNESQLYTLIITGHLQTGGNTAGSFSASGEAASLVGGLVASKLQRTLANRLPLDVLTIDAGDAGITGTQLEAGTYLTDRLYVGYVGRVGADPTRYQNRNAVHLEYQLTARWSFDGEYGDVGTGNGDLIWTKRY